MRIVCIGDSLTEGDYGISGKRGIANVHSRNYPFFLSLLTGAETVNCGKCGYRSVNMLEYYKNGNIPVKGADIIIVILGSNGGQSAKGDSPDNDAYAELIGLLREDAPEARIVLCTPPHVTVDPAMSNCGYAPQVKEAVGFVRRFAAEEELELIDLAACPLFTDATEKITQPNDGIHFTETGYLILAGFIARKLFGTA